MIAFPVTFYVANLASALPAQFPTASRYGAMGIAYNFSVAIFGGTTPFIVAALIGATGDDMMPAYYLMATSADRCRRDLLPEGIGPAPPAGFHAQRGHPGRGQGTRCHPGREPADRPVEMDMPFATAQVRC